MKIYNEIITQFNDNTGQWETIYEDSEEYSGPMAFMQGGLPPNASAINTSDTIADTIKVTAGYFTNGDGTLGGGDIFTGSLGNTNELYYYNVIQTTGSAKSVQFSVAFAHALGSGSDTIGDSVNNPTTLKGETQALYKQLTNLLLEEQEAAGGFKIAQGGASTGGWVNSGDRDDYVYVLVGKRARFKDRLNKKSWTLTLSGSDEDGVGVKIRLTDDSTTVPAIATPGGPRHNIISGTLGTIATSEGYAVRTFGWFYPEMGIMLFSGFQLSASIPGPLDYSGATAHSPDYTASFVAGYGTAAKNMRHSGSGFTPNLDNNAQSSVDKPVGNSIRLINCMQNVGQTSTTLRLRSEEDQTQENYFCRIRAEQYNFSANPSFTSGSKNKIRNKDMHGNPQTFITGLGLYNSAGQLLAIAKLSSPLKKNFASEATVKVKLTY